MGYVIAGLAGMLLVPLLLHRLGSEAYGLWIVASSAGSMVLILEAGLGWALVKEIAGSSDWDATQHLVQIAAAFYPALGAIGAVVVVASAFVLPQRLQLSPDLIPIARVVFYCAAAAFFFEQIFGFTQAVLQGLRRFDLANIVSNVVNVGRIAVIAVFVWRGAGIAAVAIVTAIAGLLGAIAGAAAIRVAEPRLKFFPPSLKWKPLAATVRFGITSHIGYTLSYWIWQVPPLVIGFFLGSAAVTPYYIGQRLSLAASGLSHRAGEALFPAASEAKSSGDLPSTLLSGNRTVAFLAFPVTILLYVFAPSVLHVWVGAISPEALTVLRITAAAVAIESLGLASMYTLWGSGDSVRILSILSAVGIGSVSLGAWWLHSFGIVGAAYAILVVVSLGSLAFMISAIRGVAVSPGRWIASSLPLAIPTLIAWLVAAAIEYWIPPASWAALIVSTFIPGGLFLVLASLLLPEAEIPSFLRRFRVLRHAFASIHILRSGYWFAAYVAQWLLNSPRTVHDDYLHTFQRPDPWNYSRQEERERFESALQLLDQVRGERRFATALEIGCAEGVFTEMLAPRCESLLAVDFIEQALDRARPRLLRNPHVTFQQADLDSMSLGQFDLVTGMIVVDSTSPFEVRRRRERVIAQVKPGGYLLLNNHRISEFIEQTRWSAWLIQGGKRVNEFYAAHPELEVLGTIVTPLAVSTIYRRRQSTPSRGED